MEQQTKVLIYFRSFIRTLTDAVLKANYCVLNLEGLFSFTNLHCSLVKILKIPKCTHYNTFMDPKVLIYFQWSQNRNVAQSFGPANSLLAGIILIGSHTKVAAAWSPVGRSQPPDLGVAPCNNPERATQVDTIVKLYHPVLKSHRYPRIQSGHFSFTGFLSTSN